MPFAATWMDLETTILSEVKSDRERQILYDVAFTWTLKKMIQMNLFTKHKQTHRHRKQTYGYQRGKEVGGINLEFGINRHTLLYIKQINNKDLLYSTGNHSISWNNL